MLLSLLLFIFFISLGVFLHLLGAQRVLFAAAERLIPRIRIETRQAERLRGKRVLVAIDSWPRNSRYPIGHYVRTLGAVGDRDTENEVESHLHMHMILDEQE